MEEWIGAQWHRWVTRAASREHEAAAVTLADMERPLSLLFRAAGGDPAVQLAPASAQRIAGPRGWLERVAGSGERAALAELAPERLALPPRLAVHPEAALNGDLYRWLGALAAGVGDGEVIADEAFAWGAWAAGQLAAARRTLRRFPGLAGARGRLARAELALRPDPATLRDAADATGERALQALLNAWAEGEDAPVRLAQGPGGLIDASRLAPVWMWLRPGVAVAAAARRDEDPAEPEAAPDRPRPQADRTRRHAERGEDGSGRDGLLMFFRAESLLSWGEFVKVHRTQDDDPDADAGRVADDMDVLSLDRGGQTLAARVRFDLDLPSAAADDRPLGPGEPLPEWDWRRRVLLPDHCVAQRLVAAAPQGFVPDPALRRTARQVRRRLELLRDAPRWRHGEPEGEQLDLDAWVRERSLPAAAVRDASPAVMSRRVRQERSLATLLLADLSLSTDAGVPQAVGGGDGAYRRVIDVIRDALFVFGEALDATGDPFEMLGFSSVRRQLRVHELKAFDARWDRTARDRTGAIKPGYYTRLGAAVRHASARLAARPERQRLLLILTDGKPNDLDVYEGRHGLEDTRHAVSAARALGLRPFCLTIDERAHDYLPHVFGQHGWALVHRPAQLVTRLTQVWAGMARGA